MGKPLGQTWDEFTDNWRRYIWQASLATLVVLATLMWQKSVGLMITASLGSSAFIVFAMPHRTVARPRNVLGGHLMGMVSGVLWGFISIDNDVGSVLVMALGVGMAIFLMNATDCEHPPAGRTALEFVREGYSLNNAIAVISGIVVLSLARFIMRRRLRDLS
jgi:CBS-domain-containing membrane protein